jgi:hypothetical protein
VKFVSTPVVASTFYTFVFEFDQTNNYIRCYDAFSKVSESTLNALRSSLWFRFRNISIGLNVRETFPNSVGNKFRSNIISGWY